MRDNGNRYTGPCYIYLDDLGLKAVSVAAQFDNTREKTRKKSLNIQVIPSDMTGDIQRGVNLNGIKLNKLRGRLGP